MRRVTGVYKIEQLSTGKVYVGSASSVSARFSWHRICLRDSKHHNAHLQRAWKKYGEADFAFTVIEECGAAELIEREQFHIDAHRSADPSFGFNICPRAGSSAGRRFSEEVRKRAAQSLDEVRSRPEVRQKISVANTGNKYSLGHKHSDEFREKCRIRMIGNSRAVGHKKPDYVRESTRKRMLGNANTKGRVMPEHEKAQRSESAKGKPKSTETRARMRLAAMNRSAEHRANISKALRAKYAKQA